MCFTEPGMIAFTLVVTLQVEPADVDAVSAHATARSIEASWTVAGSAPPPGATALKWSDIWVVHASRTSPE